MRPLRQFPISTAATAGAISAVVALAALTAGTSAAAGAAATPGAERPVRVPGRDEGGGHRRACTSAPRRDRVA